MPTCFDISASTGSYGVRIEPQSLASLLAEAGDRVFIVDAFLEAQVRAAGIDPIVIVADEPAKSLDRMTDVIVGLRERRATRATTLIAVGGGIVQDIAAFTASIYMRGIDWIYVPTSLLSMVDSCIGGKSSINVGPYKNLVGTFHPPVQVLIDPVLTGTLNAEQHAAGLIEAAKICFCRGPAAFSYYAGLESSARADVEPLAALIYHSLLSKKWFIEIDEFDRGERLLLNFGHTFGHAIETASDFAVSHGIAVGLGMLIALDLGETLGRKYGSVENVARLRAHILELLNLVPGLPAALRNTAMPRLMEAFRSDKKHNRQNYAVIVVTETGNVERLMLPRDAASDTIIEHAFREALESWQGRCAAAA